MLYTSFHPLSSRFPLFLPLSSHMSSSSPFRLSILSCTFHPHPELTLQTLIQPGVHYPTHSQSSHSPSLQAAFLIPPHLTANTPWHLIGISFTSSLFPSLPLSLLHPSILQQAERAREGTGSVQNNTGRLMERSGVIESESLSITCGIILFVWPWLCLMARVKMAGVTWLHYILGRHSAYCLPAALLCHCASETSHVECNFKFTADIFHHNALWCRGSLG